MFFITSFYQCSCCSVCNHCIHYPTFSPYNDEKVSHFFIHSPKHEWTTNLLFAITVKCSDKLSFSWYFFLRLLAVLSPNSRWGWDFLNFSTPALCPWMVAYLPISYLSLSVNLQFLSYCYFEWQLLRQCNPIYLALTLHALELSFL